MGGRRKTWKHRLMVVIESSAAGAKWGAAYCLCSAGVRGVATVTRGTHQLKPRYCKTWRKELKSRHWGRTNIIIVVIIVIQKPVLRWLALPGELITAWREKRRRGGKERRGGRDEWRDVVIVKAMRFYGKAVHLWHPYTSCCFGR